MISIKKINQLEEIISYSFKNKQLLKSALIQIDNAQTNLLKLLPAPTSEGAGENLDSEANPSENDEQKSLDD